jgi:hypothetical protein
MLGNGGGHATDGSRPGDQHVFAEHVKGKGCVGRIPQGIETGENIGWDCRITVPDIGDGDAKVLRKSPRSIDAHAARLHAEMTPSSQTVSTAAAYDMSFSRDEIVDFEIVNIVSNLNDPAYELVTDGHGDGNGLLSPLVPVVNVHIRAADCRLVNLDEDVIDPHFRHRNLFQKDAGLPFGFNQGFHNVSPILRSSWIIRGEDLLVNLLRNYPTILSRFRAKLEKELQR